MYVMMKFKTLPPAELLWEMFSYNPLTGRFMRLTDEGPRARKGVLAGYINNRGYYCVTVRGTDYLLHRLVYKWVTGNEPNETLDHYNRIPLDNHWGNLREATWHEQRMNQTRPNRALPTGVYERRGRYRAIVKRNGKTIQLGTYSSIADASAVVNNYKNY